jgi:hypothetical protein
MDVLGRDAVLDRLSEFFERRAEFVKAQERTRQLLKLEARSADSLEVIKTRQLEIETSL